MLCMPGSSHGNIWGISIKNYAIPFQSKDFLSTESGIQADHDKNIRRKSLNCSDQPFDLIICEGDAWLLLFSTLWRQPLTGASINDLTIKRRIENTLEKHLYGTIYRGWFVRNIYHRHFNIIGGDICHSHSPQWCDNIILDLWSIVSQCCGTYLSRLHYEPSCAILCHSRSCLPEYRLLNPALCLTHFFIEFLRCLCVKSDAPSVCIHQACSIVFDASLNYCSIYGNFFFLPCHFVTSWQQFCPNGIGCILFFWVALFAVCHTGLSRPCSFRAFGHILLKRRICKVHTSIWHILNIWDQSILSGCI